MALPTGIVCHTTQGTIGTASAALSSVALLCEWFRIEAAPGNTGKVYIGASGMGTGAAAAGYFVALAAGTVGMTAGYDVKPPSDDRANRVNGRAFDLNKWYVAGSAAAQVYNVTYFQRLNDG